MNIRRNIPRPPEPVDINDPQWVVRAWQWVFDRLLHLDECLDNLKEADREWKAETSALITARVTQDNVLEDKLSDHIRDYQEMVKIREAKRSVWNTQGGFFRTLLEMLYHGGGIAVSIIALKAVGII